MIKKYTILSFFLIGITCGMQAQEFAWVNQVGTTTNDDLTSITSDNSGNVYISGHSSASFVNKYDASGTLTWSKGIDNINALGNTGNSEMMHTNIDGSGNIISVGSFRATCDFDPSPIAAISITSVTASFGPTWDIFIQKLDANGDFLWAKRIGGNSSVRDTALMSKTDADGNIYVTGYFGGTVDFDSGTGINNMTANGSDDAAFLLKLDAAGNFLWSRKITTNDDSRSNALVLDASNNVYITGYFKGTLTSAFGIFTAQQTRDSFIAKFDTNGNVLGTYVYGGETESIAIDANDDLLVAGFFRSTVDLDPSPTGTTNATSAGVTDMFLTKIDASGNLIWTNTFGNTGFDDIASVAVDGQGSAYVTGRFFETIDFDPSANTNSLTSITTDINGGGDIFVAKYNNLGEYVWAYRPDGTNGSDDGRFISVDHLYNVYTIGNFVGSHDFNFLAGVNVLTSMGSYDGYILKMEQSELFAKISPKVFLQGALSASGNTSLMRDDLRVSSYLPTTSPYGDGSSCDASVFNAGGTSGTGNADDDIVDWVWVALRDATNNTNIVASAAALLQKDGDVVALDGISTLELAVPYADYYVSIHHRNHLAIMSAAVFSITDQATTVDFTNSLNQITFGVNAQKDMGTGTMALWSGDVNNDALVQYAGITPDSPFILSQVLNDAGNFLVLPTFILTGYSNADIDMDGNTQYTGTNPDTPFILQNILSDPGNFLNLSTYQILEQVPVNE
ncbi:hypothetical protein KORDIASMS9_01326 [Kordia sp. SMS9]|uniref:hypothetical protein n=1 Tax=Kordia sp. SMS9 TaxID=2282170 RepID=UPI000E10BC28|nr:hypothetical protein [Kordia sp. SMS9]AXG69107.1 hypothetical protein KORDIASMS9_01326 [Kordia sp. SMS9]